MYDIEFYMKMATIKQRGGKGELIARSEMISVLEESRNQDPYIYNIETTNACNMRCKMCPRTNLMNRKIETMKESTFEKVAAQMQPISGEVWERWVSFAEKFYSIGINEMSENHFFLYILPRVVVLHGYGDPLLDPNIINRVRILSQKDIPSYFSCNPENIDLEKCIAVCRQGLSYLKFSIESIDDKTHNEIRGASATFRERYSRIADLAKAICEEGLNTQLIVTMLNFNRHNMDDEFQELKDLFPDAYVYLKSVDQKWYQELDYQNRSIHWNEFCQFPWSSLSINSSGDVVACCADYNSDLVFGNVDQDSLQDIWNSSQYESFRRTHLEKEDSLKKCQHYCDMSLISSFFG